MQVELADYSNDSREALLDRNQEAQELDYFKGQCDEEHFHKNISWYDIFEPLLKHFTCCFKRRDDISEYRNPLNVHGAAVNQYFQINCKLLLFFTVLMIPATFLFISFGGYSSSMNLPEKFSLGRAGAIEQICDNYYF